MSKHEQKRHQLTEQLADYVLAHGLQGASLRPLAAAVGTSDRMLLHYFADKEALLTATLSLVAQRLIGLLEAVRTDPLPSQQLVLQLAPLLNDQQIRPYLRLWLELVALAAGEQEPFVSVARQICTTFLDWIAAALAVEHETERAPVAALTLAIVEGLVLLDALGDTATRNAALAGVGLWRGA